MHSFGSFPILFSDPFCPIAAMAYPGGQPPYQVPVRLVTCAGGHTTHESSRVTCFHLFYLQILLCHYMVDTSINAKECNPARLVWFVPHRALPFSLFSVSVSLSLYFQLPHLCLSLDLHV